MPTMTRNRDGAVQTVQATDAQIMWYLGQGYAIVDAGTAPVAPVGALVRSVVVASGQLVVTYTDGTQTSLGGLSGGTGPGAGGSFAYDTDGTPYLATPGTVGAVGYALDTDQVPYLLPVA